VKCVGYGKLEDDTLMSFEEELSFQLPEDYEHFLRQNNGGNFMGARYRVSDLDADEPLNVLFGINVERAQDLRFWRKEMAGEIPENSLIIGDGTCGGFILLYENCVHFYDHQHYYAQSSKDKNTYRISDSFGEFIDSLKAPLTYDEILAQMPALLDSPKKIP
jgi:hypothetical protein